MSSAAVLDALINAGNDMCVSHLYEFLELLVDFTLAVDQSRLVVQPDISREAFETMS